MTDFPHKIVTVVLAVLMVVFAPLCWNYLYHDKQAEVLILNEMEEFLDKATDKGYVTQSDLDQLYLDVNSHGIVMDVDVKRLIRVASPMTDGTTKSVYFTTEELLDTNPGDVIQIHAEEIGTSKADLWLHYLVGVDESPLELQLAAVIG